MPKIYIMYDAIINLIPIGYHLSIVNDKPPKVLSSMLFVSKLIQFPILIKLNAKSMLWYPIKKYATETAISSMLM